MQVCETTASAKTPRRELGEDWANADLNSQKPHSALPVSVKEDMPRQISLVSVDGSHPPRILMQPLRANHGSGRAMKILIVDHSPVTRRVVRTLFESVQFSRYVEKLKMGGKPSKRLPSCALT